MLAALALVACFAPPARVVVRTGGADEWTFAALDRSAGSSLLSRFSRTYPAEVDFSCDPHVESAYPQGLLAFCKKGEAKLVLHYVERPYRFARIMSIGAPYGEQEAAAALFRKMRHMDAMVLDDACRRSQPRWSLLERYHMGRL